MKTPKMICFDYGETLVHEEVFNGIKGYSKILEYVKDNPYNITAKELADIAFKLNTELGRFDPSKRHLIQTEVSDYAFEKYILESKNITLRLPYEEIANDFWDAACYGKATEGIKTFFLL